jgi:hypothetical protein|tara:strand:- start:3190 stop:3345 length:156 start_codon:yes stop_codon:yes gene_type:complete
MADGTDNMQQYADNEVNFDCGCRVIIWRKFDLKVNECVEHKGKWRVLKNEF